MACPFQIFSQSDYLIQIVDINLLSDWPTVQIQISWLLQKPTDLELHCLQRQDISGLSRSRVNIFILPSLPIFIYINIFHWLRCCNDKFRALDKDSFFFSTKRFDIIILFCYFFMKTCCGYSLEALNCGTRYASLRHF